MTVTLNMTTLYTCLILVCLVRACQGKPIWPVTGLLIGAPFAYMVSHLPPNMQTPLGECALAVINVLGPVIIAMICGFRHLHRKMSLEALKDATTRD